MAFRPGQQALPEAAEPGLLALGYLAVVRHGEEPGPESHGCLNSLPLISLMRRT
jgi:hypothetical protein